MNVSEPFIRRPIATSLLAAAVLIAGFAAYKQLPVSPLPRVDFPTISVSASLPGGSPETMASSVATPLERRFGRIAGVDEITSTSTLGSSNITLQFDLDRDVDSAARDVQAAINAALGELPPGLPARPSYRKVNPSDTPILVLSLTSETLTLAQIYDQANSILAQRISQVSGVGQVTVSGGQQPAVRVQADTAALAGLGLSLEDVRTTLSQMTVDQPVGALNGVSQQRVLGANDQLFGAASFRPLVLRYQNGAPVRLQDVAHVIDDVENNRNAAWINGHAAILVIIRRQPGANILETIQRIRDVLPTLAQSISPGVDVRVALDRAGTIRASVNDVEFTLVLSVVLVVAVVFVFLRNVRATIIPSVAVPLSIVATFAVMYLLGYSVDNLSLMALTISTGFVVDDAIVVSENVARYMEAGDTPLEASLKGARQIGFTIISITCSLLAVFIPILCMGGIIGRLFREFAVTLSVSIAVSAVVSLTVTPAMCSRLLRPMHASEQGWLYRTLEKLFDGLLHLYERALRVVLNHRGATLFVALATVGLTGYLFFIIPKGIFPQQDTGFLFGFSEAAQDISFPAMRERQMQINAIVLQDPDVAHVMSFMGAGNTGTILVDLRESPPRRVSADDVINRLRRRLGSVPGMMLYLQSRQDLSVGARQGRTQYQYTLEDMDLTELRTWAPRLLTALQAVPQLRDVATDQQNAGLQMNVVVDRDTAARLGIASADVDNTLYDAFGQRQVATSYTQLNQYRVILEAAPLDLQSPNGLRHIFVRTPGGGQAPLAAIAQYSPSMTPLAVNHQGQFPAVTLSFNLAPGVSLGQAVNAIYAAEERIGLPAGVHAEFAGTAKVFESSLANQWLLIAAALVTVYLVLGMLYESLIHPITILSTLPSAGVGALLALILFKTDFTIIALIGILLLIGIVKKNAIMMIDFAIEAERDEGLSPRDAIFKACVQRFRPIMMTTMAALLGGLPLALGHGAGSELRRPLGISIVGGLTISQMLTLFTTPVIYLALDRFTKKKQRRSMETVPPAAPVEPLAN